MVDFSFLFKHFQVATDSIIYRSNNESYEVIYITGGKGHGVIGSQSRFFKAGEMMLIPPYINYEFKYVIDGINIMNNNSYISISFKPETLKFIALSIPELDEVVDKIFKIKQARLLAGSDAAPIIKLMISMKEKKSIERIPAMIELLIRIAQTKNFVEVGKRIFPVEKDLRMDKLRSYCASNYMKTITISEVSAHLGMNKNAFCNYIKKKTGLTFTKFLNTKRLAIAKEQIEKTDLKISEIAYATGFSSISYFNRLFKKQYTISPIFIRKMSRSNNVT